MQTTLPQPGQGKHLKLLHGRHSYLVQQQESVVLRHVCNPLKLALRCPLPHEQVLRIPAAAAAAGTWSGWHRQPGMVHNRRCSLLQQGKSRSRSSRTAMAEAGGPRQRQAGISRRRAAATTAAVRQAGGRQQQQQQQAGSTAPELETVIQIAQRHGAAGGRKGSRRGDVGNMRAIEAASHSGTHSGIHTACTARRGGPHSTLQGSRCGSALTCQIQRRICHAREQGLHVSLVGCVG